jgi:hypothetical protein
MDRDLKSLSPFVTEVCHKKEQASSARAAAQPSVACFALYVRADAIIDVLQ